MKILKICFVLRRKQCGGEKMAAAVPSRPDLGLDEDTCLVGSRMNRLDNFKLRIRKANTGDAAMRRGPVVSTNNYI